MRFFKIIFVALAFLSVRLWAQNVGSTVTYSWDFSGAAIRDILYAVSFDTGMPIVADATVNGNGDFRFVGGNFETAFDAFLSASRLYVEKNDTMWMVSRARVRNIDEKIYVDACDVLPSLLLEKISSATGAVITYTTLPSVPVTAHLAAENVSALLNVLVRQFAGYEMEENVVAKTFHFQQAQRTNSLAAVTANDNSSVVVREADGTFSCDIKNAQFSLIAEKFFSAAGLPYCILAGGTNMIARAVFGGYDFEKTLSLLCGQCALEAVESDGVYCIVNGQSNRTALVGAGRTWQVFALSYTNTQEFLPIMAKRFSDIEPVAFPDKTKFACSVNEEEKNLIYALISDFDFAKQTYLVKLKYTKTADFLAHLPPSVDTSNLRDAGDGSSVFFTGTQEAYEELLAQLELCDRPVARISYDVLIMQYEDTVDKSWSSNLGVRRMRSGDRNGVTAQLGSVLSFNLDVVGIFGLAFAAEMQAAIAENKAHVFADTTVHGVSGRKISFQNTNTYRYRDNNIDPETGKPLYTGITREISSGLKIDILGWVSGDGMITSEVTASMSRQGKDVSATTGNPPPTTEKIITTEVRGRNYEPVILSGLIQNADTSVSTRTPVLSRVPVLGNLFKSKVDTVEKTEMVIYLVPHIESDENFGAVDKVYSGEITAQVRREKIDDSFAFDMMKIIAESCFSQKQSTDKSVATDAVLPPYTATFKEEKDEKI